MSDRRIYGYRIDIDICMWRDKMVTVLNVATATEGRYKTVKR